MRLDKFLKVSRIIKRRSVAKEIADQGRILINNLPAKSSSKVKVGDTLTIKFGNKTETIKINRIVETTMSSSMKPMQKTLINRYKKNDISPG